MGTLDERIRGVNGQDMTMCSSDYIKAIHKVGGTPIIISPILQDDYIDHVIELCDGILFSGGSDINSLYYGENPGKSGRVVPERDQFEMKLLKKAYQKDMPLLGICRGLQLINVFLEGSLNQDIDLSKPNQQKHDILNLPKWHNIHKVIIEKDSFLFNAYKETEIKTNSLHHQSIKKLGNDLKVTARSSDHTIEGIEVTNKYFITAVQWHPEMMFAHSPLHLKLFKYFIFKTKEYI
ncbi:MAG TPA: gamma-glutamyl-gamma-aminobutyrate hydrolase family protein [Halanaerobiales bacterium]|nr:gamma-glutamyl-gamma-aminobutyrate hydrolase family protein [Halanaerobiales bacterium]